MKDTQEKDESVTIPTALRLFMEKERIPKAN
jgi:seryl-tRNA synthetase